MNILHVYKDYYPVLGGIENHVKVLAEAQARAGHNVIVLVTARGPRTTIEDIGGVRVIKAGRFATLASAPLSLSLPIILARLRPDITHLHFPYPLGEAAQALLGRSRRTVITYHSDIVRQQGLLRLYRPLLWRVLAKADRIIATSPNYVTTSPYLQRFADKCVIIPLGVDVDRFQQADPAQVAAIRTKGRQRPILLFVGRLRYYKGLDDLLRAMALLRDTRDHLTATLLICGSGPMEAAWRALTQELGLTEQVHFLGDVPEETLPALYHAADLYVLPANSRAEAFGVALLEAMAAGLPVISTEVGTGTSYVNIHGETGLIVPPRDPQRLAQAIATLLNDLALRQRLGAQAQARVRAKFSQATMIERVLDLYSEVSRQ
ncbi:MAG: glycosyl transferase family 1 [Chloroflexota bacterium]